MAQPFHGTPSGLAPIARGNPFAHSAPTGLPLQTPLTSSAFSTYLGWGAADYLSDMARHPSGDYILVGTTQSGPLPGESLIGPGGNRDILIARVRPASNQLVGVARIGGFYDEESIAVECLASGRICVLGHSRSFNYPTTGGAFDPSFNGPAQINAPTDLVVTCIEDDLQSLVFSTFVGGAGQEWAADLAVTSTGRPVVVGYSNSTAFPTTPGAFDTTPPAGDYDATVTILRTNGSGVLYSTFMGGSADDWPAAVLLEGDGSVLVAGLTWSANYPTTQVLPGSSFTPGENGFVSRVDATATSLVSSVIVGGADRDELYSLGTDGLGRVYVSGWTRSADYPVTPGAYRTTYSGLLNDMCVTRLGHGLDTVEASTFFGGTSFDIDVARTMLVDKSGSVTLAGSTTSASVGTTPGSIKSVGQGPEAFLCRFDPQMQTMLYMTYWGGSQIGLYEEQDSIVAIDIDQTGQVAAAGNTTTLDFPVSAGAPQPTIGGVEDGFFSLLSAQPQGVAIVGTPSGACGATATCEVGASIVAGDPELWIYGRTVAPLDIGIAWIQVSGTPLPGWPILGTTAFVDPTFPSIVAPYASDGAGWFEVVKQAPASSAGIALTIQQFGLCAGSGDLQLFSSNALSLTIQ